MVAMHLEHVPVLVAEHELQQPVLHRLETGRFAEDTAEFGVFRRRQRIEHLPLTEQLVLHLTDPVQALDRPRQGIVAEEDYRAVELVEQKLHPQLRDLMLDDEQQLVGVRRIAKRFLRRQQLAELEVGRVVIVGRQLGMDALLDLAVAHVGCRARKTIAQSNAPGTVRTTSIREPGNHVESRASSRRDDSDAAAAIA